MNGISVYRLHYFGVSKRWTLFDNGKIQDIFMHGCTKIKWHGVQIEKKIQLLSCKVNQA